MKVDICCIGELLVDFVALDSSRSLLQALDFRRCAGGAPANVAVGISRLGGNSGLIACVGTDVWGDYLVQAMKEEGVFFDSIQRTRHASTTLAFVSLAEDGERDFSFMRNPGADTHISGMKIEDALIKSCGILHFGSLSLSADPSRYATMNAIDSAKAASATISMDLNFRSNLWNDPSEALARVRETFPQVDILKVSEEEAEFLTGEFDPVAAANELLEKGPSIVLVSMGEGGCIFATNRGSQAVPGFKANCIDATGAGDSFMAAFLTRFYADEMPFESDARIREACKFANAAASITVEKIGAIPALPHLPDVTQKLELSARRV